MAKLVFDAEGQRFYETGIRDVVLFTKNGNEGTEDHEDEAYGKGVAWNGITAITEKPSGAESNKVYADDITYLNLISNEEFGLTIEAYQWPEEFNKCDGTANYNGVNLGQQKRETFGLCYKTALGNDVDGYDHGYKLHIVYGCMAAPSERGYATVNDSPEAITFSWEVTTTPVSNLTEHMAGGSGDITEHFLENAKPITHIEIDSTKADAELLEDLLGYLYGNNSRDPNLLKVKALLSVLEGAY